MSQDPSNAPRPDELSHAAQSSPDANLDPRNEQDLWHGRESWKAFYPTLALWTIALLAILIIVFAWPNESLAQRRWTVAGYATLAAVGVLAVLLIRRALRIWSRSYRITTQRLFIRAGILRQTVDQTELLRVDDVQMTQTLLQRMLDIGNIEVLSSDRTDARTLISGVDNPAAVAEHIRQRTRTMQQRTLFMEQL